MARIHFTPQRGSMAGTITQVPVFPGEHFGVNCPEAIGDAARTVWQNRLRPEWQELDDGAWQSRGALDGELAVYGVSFRLFW